MAYNRWMMLKFYTILFKLKIKLKSIILNAASVFRNHNIIMYIMKMHIILRFAKDYIYQWNSIISFYTWTLHEC